MIWYIYQTIFVCLRISSPPLYYPKSRSVTRLSPRGACPFQSLLVLSPYILSFQLFNCVPSISCSYTISIFLFLACSMRLSSGLTRGHLSTSTHCGYFGHCLQYPCLMVSHLLKARQFDVKSMTFVFYASNWCIFMFIIGNYSF